MGRSGRLSRGAKFVAQRQGVPCHPSLGVSHPVSASHPTSLFQTSTTVSSNLAQLAHSIPEHFSLQRCRRRRHRRIHHLFNHEPQRLRHLSHNHSHSTEWPNNHMILTSPVGGKEVQHSREVIRGQQRYKRYVSDVSYLLDNPDGPRAPRVLPAPSRPSWGPIEETGTALRTWCIARLSTKPWCSRPMEMACRRCLQLIDPSGD